MASGEPPKLSSRDIGGLTGAASFRDCISAASATQLGPPGHDVLGGNEAHVFVVLPLGFLDPSTTS
jgi:hypothetical protein